MRAPSIALRLILSVLLVIGIIGVGFGVVIRSLNSVEDIFQSESNTHISALMTNSIISRKVFELSSRVQLLEQAFLYSETALSEESFRIDQQLQEMRSLSNSNLLTEKMDVFIENFHRFLGSSLSLNHIIRRLNDVDNELKVDLELLEYYLSDARMMQVAFANTDKTIDTADLNHMLRESFLRVGKMISTIRSRITPETEKVMIIGAQKEFGIFLLHLANVPAINSDIIKQKKKINRRVIKYTAALRQMKANLDQRWVVVDELILAQNDLLGFAKEIESDVQTRAIELQNRLEQDVSEARLIVTFVSIFALLIGMLLIIRMVDKHLRQPLKALNVGLKNIESNDFYERIDLGNSNEWNTLATAFNSMAAKLQTTYTELNEQQRKFNFLAHHDPLTGLANRLLGTSYLQDVINEYRPTGKAVSLLYLDVDNFKSINDSLGHEAGDSLLQDAARLLSRVVGEHGKVARMGGDEFMVILDKVESSSHAQLICHQINEAMRIPYKIGEIEVFVSASIGLCHFPKHGENVETLIRNADTAMYQAKREGRDCFRLYQHAMTSEANDFMELSNALRNAIHSDELEVFFQPFMDTQTGNMIGAEALIRWNHPTEGLLLPGAFLSMAEKIGVIEQIDTWVFKRVVEKLIDWKAQGVDMSAYDFSVNFSGRKFHVEDLVESLDVFLDGHDDIAKQMIIEITENDLIQGLESSLDTIRSLRSRGYRVAIDDFGTGYSSLSSLKSIPADIIKLDRGFIEHIENNERDMEIVKTIQHLVAQLDLMFIVEGVETAGQVERLTSIGSHLVQGYFFAKPMSEPAFLALVKTQMVKNTP